MLFLRTGILDQAYPCAPTAFFLERGEKQSTPILKKKKKGIFTEHAGRSGRNQTGT